MELGNSNKNNLSDLDKKNKYSDKDYVLLPDSDNDSHSLIVREIKDGSLVLDVGCGSGVIGDYLNKNKNVKMYGIELDKLAIKEAQSKKAYTKIYNIDVTNKAENTIAFFEEPITFDYIIMADVLEHIYDPEQFILLLSKKLKSNGQIIISIPSIEHNDIVVGLINGIFNYSEKGILDNTHLRFFTENSFREFIDVLNEKNKQDFSLELIAQTKKDTEKLDKYPNVKELFKYNNNGQVIQNIFRLTKGKGKLNHKTKEDKQEMLSILEQKLADLKKYESIHQRKLYKMTDKVALLINKIKK